MAGPYINKEKFYLGEEVRIYGRIEPPPEVKTLQLVRWYYCPRWKTYRRAADLWTYHDGKGNYEFKFKATVEKAQYCNVSPGEVQAWRGMVRYQPKPGVPPRAHGVVEWSVVNAKPPTEKPNLKFTRVNYPEYATPGFVVKIEWAVVNRGGEGLAGVQLVDLDAGITWASRVFTIRAGGTREDVFTVVMPNRDWRLELRAVVDATVTDKRQFTIRKSAKPVPPPEETPERAVSTGVRVATVSTALIVASALMSRKK